MDVFNDSVLNASGDSLQDATITVRDASTLSLASLYEADGATGKANPFVTNSDGEVEFSAINGRYQVTVEHADFEDDVKIIELYDPNDRNTRIVVESGPVFLSDEIVIVQALEDIELTFPAIADFGTKRLTIINDSDFTVTLTPDGTGPDTINDEASITMEIKKEKLDFDPIDTNWY